MVKEDERENDLKNLIIKRQSLLLSHEKKMFPLFTSSSEKKTFCLFSYFFFPTKMFLAGVTIVGDLLGVTIILSLRYLSS